MPDWDLLVVDEAHHLVWAKKATKPRVSWRLNSWPNRSLAYLLLTATPEQLGLESHFARLRLLDPNRFHDFAAFVEEQQHYRPIADAVDLLLADKHLSATMSLICLTI